MEFEQERWAGVSVLEQVASLLEKEREYLRARRALSSPPTDEGVGFRGVGHGVLGLGVLAAGAVLTAVAWQALVHLADAPQLGVSIADAGLRWGVVLVGLLGLSVLAVVGFVALALVAVRRGAARQRRRRILHNLGARP